MKHETAVWYRTDLLSISLREMSDVVRKHCVVVGYLVLETESYNHRQANTCIKERIKSRPKVVKLN